MRHALAAALVALLPLACAEAAGTQPSRAVVLVSGLDDHGLPETDAIPLHARPGGPVRTTVPAGTLVRALEVRGEWTRVAALEAHAHDGASAGGGGSADHAHDFGEGWVGDYYLRGRLHVIAADDPVCPVEAWAEPGGTRAEPLPASAQVEVVTVTHDGARLWARVRTVAEPEREAWVPRAALSEYSSQQLVEGLGHTHGSTDAPALVESTGDC